MLATKVYFRILFFWLVMMSLFRVGLSLWSADLVFKFPEWYRAFIYGVRFDFMVFSFALSLLYLGWAFSQGPIRQFFKYSIILFFLFAAFNEVATFNYFSEYGSRLDRQVFEFANRPQEVLRMLIKAFYWHFIAAAIVIYILTRILSRYLLPEQLTDARFGWRLIPNTVLVIVLSFIGARSSFGHRPANISTASFSSEFWLNQLGLNSTYTLAYAALRAKDETNPMSIYPTAEIKELLALYREQGQLENKKFLSEDLKNVFYSSSNRKTENKTQIKNVVWIVEESFGAEFTGSIGNLKLTPNFDRWSERGVLFTQLYATGTRTARGLEALLTGLPPTPSFSVLKLAKANRGFFTIATQLKNRGYQTIFMYPGDSNFDEMRAFFLGNGFDKVYDQQDLSEGLKRGVWGIHDDDLLVKANAFLKEQSQPTFLVVLTTSNHTPYDYDATRIQLDPRFPKESHENAIHYADNAIGIFFDLASREKYFSESLFMVVGDHNTRVYDQEYFPVHKFHIPALMIAPSLAPQKYDKMMSQIDLLPTVIGALGPNNDLIPYIGRDVLNTDLPGRAIMQYNDEYLYMDDDKKALLLRPKLEAQVFSLAKGEWDPLQYDKSFFEKGFKYPALAWFLYDNELLKTQFLRQSNLLQK